MDVVTKSFLSNELWIGWDMVVVSHRNEKNIDIGYRIKQMDMCNRRGHSIANFLKKHKNCKTVKEKFFMDRYDVGIR